LYPRSVSTPIDEASISLNFRKIPVMVRCIITGLERGEGFAQLWNFSNFLGDPRPLCAPTQKYSCENAAARRMQKFCARPQTKLRTGRELPVLYYISYGYIFPHTNHHSEKSARADSYSLDRLIDCANKQHAYIHTSSSRRTLMLPRAMLAGMCAAQASAVLNLVNI
jgi:hypothetical protein